MCLGIEAIEDTEGFGWPLNWHCLCQLVDWTYPAFVDTYHRGSARGKESR